MERPEPVPDPDYDESKDPVDPIAAIVGKNISRIRNEKQLTVRELADEIDASPYSVSSWEHGRRPIRTSSICRIARALGVPPQTLVMPTTDAHASASDNQDQIDGRSPFVLMPLVAVNTRTKAQIARKHIRPKDLYDLKRIGDFVVPWEIAWLHPRSFGFIVPNGNCSFLFSEGQRVLIDPDRKDLHERNVVLAVYPDGSVEIVRAMLAKSRITIRFEAPDPKVAPHTYKTDDPKLPYIIGSVIWDYKKEAQIY